MRASRSKKRTDGARSTQNRGGAGRARKADAGALERPANRAAKSTTKSGKPARSPDRANAAGKVVAKTVVKTPTKTVVKAATKAATKAVAKEAATTAVKSLQSRRKPAPSVPPRRHPTDAERFDARRMGDEEAATHAAPGPSALVTSFVNHEGRGAEAGAMLVPVAERGSPPPLPAPIASFVF
jgi:hypothetical protein